MLKRLHDKIQGVLRPDCIKGVEYVSLQKRVVGTVKKSLKRLDGFNSLSLAKSPDGRSDRLTFSALQGINQFSIESLLIVRGYISAAVRAYPVVFLYLLPACGTVKSHGKRTSSIRQSSTTRFRFNLP